MQSLNRNDSVIVYPGQAGRPLYYIPYLAEIECLKRPRYRIRYNGGEVDVSLKTAEAILFYGASGSIPVAFLDDASTYRVPITFHRTHRSEPYLLTPAVSGGRGDLLTRQILKREDGRTRLYVAKQFSIARIESLAWLVPISKTQTARARQATTLERLRLVEAEASARYWDAYFLALGNPDANRRDRNPVAKALDAALLLVRGVLLRWTIHHRLLPSHGYLHEPVVYDALVFDLIEPYRALIERAVHAAALSALPDAITPTVAVEAVKAALAAPVYVPATQQTVAAKHLLHGAVLALRAYLSGDMLRLTLPVPGQRKAGRPFQTSYCLPGNRQG